MTEYRSCGCVIPDESDPILCARCAPATDTTHIRAEGMVGLCGQPAASSISRRHWDTRETPAIGWHIEHLPGRLCAECVSRA